MGLDAFPLRGRQAEMVAHAVRMVGTGATAPTKEYGNGISIARTSEGLYTLTWAEDPGTYVMATHVLSAATPLNMAGHTLVLDTYASKVLPFQLHDSLFAVDDLEAVEYIDIMIWFKTTAV